MSTNVKPVLSSHVTTSRGKIRVRRVVSYSYSRHRRKVVVFCVGQVRASKRDIARLGAVDTASHVTWERNTIALQTAVNEPRFTRLLYVHLARRVAVTRLDQTLEICPHSHRNNDDLRLP